MQGADVFAGGMMSIFITLITCVSVLVPLGITGAIFWFILKKNKARQHLVATGIPGQANIIQMGDTGVRINDQPRLSIVLDVHPVQGAAGFAPFRVTHQCTVPMMAMARVSPGVSVPVKCDPANPSNLTIDWGAMGFMV